MEWWHIVLVVVGLIAAALIGSSSSQVAGLERENELLREQNRELRDRQGGV